MKPPRDIIRFIKSAAIDTKSPADARVLRRMRTAYEDSATVEAQRPAGSRIVRFAVAAAILIGAGVLVGHVVRFAGGNVAWADVSRRFQAVPFFSVSIYLKEDATAEPTQMELWMRQDGRIRLRKGTQVVFAHGSWIQAYDIKSRQPVEADEMARAFIERIGRAEEFSLDAIIEVMFGGETTDVTPLINPDAVISQDVVVFDVTLPHTPEWVRIWALRESRLPVRITIWDPRDGESTDAIFTYSREQPAEFFDPNAFETLLQGRSAGSQVNVVYAFLTDPGGRNITPEEMFARSGYHVPQVEPGVADVTLDHDLVYRVGTPGLRMSEFVLDFFGATVIEVNEPRRVWIARYDGRALKDYHKILAPVPHDASPGRKTGTASSASIGGFGVTDLFRSFVADQDRGTQADGILIVDETGITEKVSREIPNWEGPEAIDMARRWFADEFGITFTEETRRMTTHVIRPKR